MKSKYPLIFIMNVKLIEDYRAVVVRNKDFLVIIGFRIFNKTEASDAGVLQVDGEQYFGFIKEFFVHFREDEAISTQRGDYQVELSICMQNFGVQF